MGFQELGMTKPERNGFPDRYQVATIESVIRYFQRYPEMRVAEEASPNLHVL